MKPESKRPDAAEQLIEDLITFCQTHARWFQNWPRETVREYIEFHALQNTLVFLRNQQGEIIAFAVGWQCDASMLQRPEFIGQPFYWQSTDPEGDAFYINDLICIVPDAVSSLIAELEWRFPAWRRLKFYARRHGKLRSFDPEKIMRRTEALFINQQPKGNFYVRRS